MDLQKAFENALMVINDMTDDAARIKEKYGAESRLLERRLNEIAVFKDLYRLSARYINTNQDEAHIKEVNYKVMEAVAFKGETGLPWAKMAVVMGDPNVKRWEYIDKIDQLIENVKKADESIREKYKLCPACQKAKE